MDAETKAYFLARQDLFPTATTNPAVGGSLISDREQAMLNAREARLEAGGELSVNQSTGAVTEAS